MIIPPLFALGFGAPALLGGLALASVPIIIHLLSRRKYREMEWAAMKWLLAALKKNARRIQIEQLILLAVRTLLVVAVVLAMTKPFLHGAGAVLLPGKRTHRILVLDNSLSMGYRVTDRSRFERAKQVALAILEESRKGDVASLLSMSAPPRVVVGEPSANLAAVADEVRSLEWLQGRAEITATLEKIAEVVAASNLEQKEIYLITDLQRANWSQIGAASAPIQQIAARIAAEASLVLIDLGQATSDNVAVTSFQLDDSIVTVDRDIRFSTVFRNFGRTAHAGLSVTLNVDGITQDRRSIDLGAGEQTALVFSSAFSSPGWHLVEVALEDDSLPTDNKRSIAVQVKERMDVLLVDGEVSGDRFGSEVDYLRVALAPDVAGEVARSAIMPEIVRESEFREVQLERYDAVLFANVGQCTEHEAQRLEDYLRQGGSVAWFLGDQIDSESYNRHLYRDGTGIFPAKLGTRVGDAHSRQSFILFDPRNYEHPIVQSFRGAAQGGLLTTKVFEYVRAELPDNSRARVALAFEGGDPALITSAVERGRVAVVTTSADVEWTNWPFWPSYVPIMNELVHHLVADRMRGHTVTVGDSLSAAVPAAALEVPITVELPNGQSVVRRLPPRDQVEYFLFEQTHWSGLYEMSFGPPLASVLHYAVNPDPLESDLSKLEPEELRERIPGWRFDYLTNWQAIATGQSSVTQNRGELQRYLVYAAMLLLFLESFLAWKFGHYST